MKLQMQFIPIPYNSGNSGPMTEAEVKIYTGIWILMNAIWFVCLIPTFFSCLKKWWKKERVDWTDRYDYDFLGEVIFLILDVMMILIWFVVLLFWTGEKISHLL